MDKVIATAIIVTFTAVVLFFDPRIFNGFSLPKVTILHIGATFTATMLVIRWIVSRKLPFPRCMLTYCIVLFLLGTLLASITAVNKYQAFFGSYGRWEGFFSHLCYVVLCFGAAVSFKKRFFLHYLLAISTLVAIYGIVQHYLAPEHSWEKHFGERTVSTIGNPVFLGAYLLIVQFPLLQSYLAYDNKIVRLIYFIGIGIIHWCFQLTISRAVTAAFIIAMVVFVILLRQLLFKKYKIAAAVLCLMLAIFIHLNFLQKETSVIQRLQRDVIVDVGGVKLAGTAESRIHIWESAINIIKAYPWFGVGPDNMDLVFSKYKTRGYFDVSGQYMSADRAHNEFLDICVTRGFIGLIIWLIFVVALFSTALKGRGDRGLKYGIIAGICGFIVANQFNFGETVTNTLMWLLVGLMLSPYTSQVKTKFKFSMLALPTIVTLFLALFIIRPYIADAHYKRGLVNEAAGTYMHAIHHYNKAIKIYPHSQKYYGTLVELYFKNPKDLSYIKEAETTIKTALKYFPNHSILFNLLGMAYYYQYELTQDKRLLLLSVKNFKEAIKQDKHFVDAYNNLGAAYLKLGMIKESIAALQTSYNLDPSPARLQTLANVYFEKGFISEAKKLYAKIVEKFPHNIEACNKLGYILYKEGDFSGAYKYFEKILKLKGNNDAYASNMLKILKPKVGK